MLANNGRDRVGIKLKMTIKWMNVREWIEVIEMDECN